MLGFILICPTSKMSHGRERRDSWLCTRRDGPGRWLWRLVRQLHTRSDLCGTSCVLQVEHDDGPYFFAEAGYNCGIRCDDRTDTWPTDGSGSAGKIHVKSQAPHRPATFELCHLTNELHLPYGRRTVLFAPTAFHAPHTRDWVGEEVAGIEGRVSGWGMARTPARFRISIKDQKSRTTLKVELIDAPGVFGERRFVVRVNGRAARALPEGTLTDILDRLRRWLVRRAARRSSFARPAEDRS